MILCYVNLYIRANLDLLNEIVHDYVTGEKAFIVVNQLVSHG